VLLLIEAEGNERTIRDTRRVFPLVLLADATHHLLNDEDFELWRKEGKGGGDPVRRGERRRGRRGTMKREEGREVGVLETPDCCTPARKPLHAATKEG
jgi:hypothetical protein